VLYPVSIVVIDNSETIAQELRLVSNSDNAFRWVAGVQYFSQDRFRSLATTFLGFPVPAAARFVGLPADIAWPSKPRQAGVEFSFRY